MTYRVLQNGGIIRFTAIVALALGAWPFINFRLAPAADADTASTPKSSRYQADTSQLKPLTDMGPADDYHGSKGGLYPDAHNERPAAHENAGIKLSSEIHPLDADGKPAPDGKIVLLGIGFSNTLQCFKGFMDVSAEAKGLNPHVVLVNGAHGGRSAFMIESLDNPVGADYWKSWVPSHLKDAGVTAAQVQVVWLKETDAQLGPGQLKMMGVDKYDCAMNHPFPDDARMLQAELGQIVRIIHGQFPNVKMVYLSSRSYGGWAQRGNTEPFSYDTGYAVKWLIEQQIQESADLNFDSAKGEAKAPWLSWGPYLWANAEEKRQDGFSNVFEDYRSNDHLHHSDQGIKKMGMLLLQFFQKDSTTRAWFNAP
jgi:hypothetical protein